MKAINHYIIVSKIKIEPKKVAGLIMTEDIDTDNRYIKANVISVGNSVPVIKKGDSVHYDAFAGHDIAYNDNMYRVIRSRDIVIVE